MAEEPLTPAQDQTVRRLLADARHQAPAPPDVVARLDRVLVELAAEPRRRARVVELASRRRRVGTLLVAAAAVVAIGVGVSQVVPLEGADDGASTAADRAEVGAAEPGGSGAESAPLPGASTDGFASKDLVRIRPQALADDVTQAREGYLSANRSLREELTADRATADACGTDAWGRGRFVPVRYGRDPAVLVFRRPVGDSQVVDLFLCGSSEPARSVTLPAP